jgi:hypothetical protein
MGEFHAESGERCERVDDETTAITGVVISVTGIGPGLDGTVDADRMRNPIVFASSESIATLRPGNRITERTSR